MPNGEQFQEVGESASESVDWQSENESDEDSEDSYGSEEDSPPRSERRSK